MSFLLSNNIKIEVKKLFLKNKLYIYIINKKKGEKMISQKTKKIIIIYLLIFIYMVLDIKPTELMPIKYLSIIVIVNIAIGMNIFLLEKENIDVHKKFMICAIFLGTVLIVIVLWFGGTLILQNDSTITAPSFIFYLVMLYSLINPLKEFSRASYNIPKGLASMERVDKILKAENKMPIPVNPIHIAPLKEKIEFKIE